MVRGLTARIGMHIGSTDTASLANVKFAIIQLLDLPFELNITPLNSVGMVPNVRMEIGGG